MLPSTHVALFKLKNIIFASKSYDRKGKIHEAIEHHNHDVQMPFRQEKFNKMKDSPYAFLGDLIIFFGLILLGTGKLTALGEVHSLGHG